MELGPVQQSALNWLFGYVVGSGGEVPDFVRQAFGPRLVPDDDFEAITERQTHEG